MADRRPVVNTVDELDEELNSSYCRWDDDLIGAFADDELVGFQYTYHLPSHEVTERCYVFGTTHPLHRGRGVGTAMLEWGVDRARHRLAGGSSDQPKVVRVDALDHVVDALALFSEHGFVASRYFSEMELSLTERRDVVTPDGLSIVKWPDDDPEFDEVVRVMKNIAFADHWGSSPTDTDGWHQKVRGFGARRDLSFVAVDLEGSPVGLALTHRYPDDDEVLGRRGAWLDTVGTLREWRGRGVASALINRALNSYLDDELEMASIGVDSDSPTGANRLYESLGFAVARRTVTFDLTM